MLFTCSAFCVRIRCNRVLLIYCCGRSVGEFSPVLVLVQFKKSKNPPYLRSHWRHKSNMLYNGPTTLGVGRNIDRMYDSPVIAGKLQTTLLRHRNERVIKWSFLFKHLNLAHILKYCDISQNALYSFCNYTIGKQFSGWKFTHGSVKKIHITC